MDNNLAIIFASIFDVSNEDARSIRRATEPKWDSLAHVTLITAIQSEFTLELSPTDFEHMTSYAATRMLLEDKGL